MKKTTVIVLLASLVALFSSCKKSLPKDSLTPTDLTIVVTDKSYKVLDTVAVEPGSKSLFVTFTVPDGVDEIRVFALGGRVDKDIPSNYYTVGRPKDKKWMGRGFVECLVDGGVLVSVSGNGVGALAITESMREQIALDLKGAAAAPLTSLEDAVSDTL